MKRQIENRIEVPGTPRDVWEAIATGHGIESWFVPATVEQRVGGRVRLDMGDGMEDAGTVTAYDAPRRFAYEEQWAPTEGEPAGLLASEFLVEAQENSTCIVRLVSTLQADGGDWDEMFKSLEAGWDVFLAVLKIQLTYFPGRRVRATHTAGETTLPDGIVEFEDGRDTIVRHEHGVALAYEYEWQGETRSGIRRYELVSAG